MKTRYDHQRTVLLAKAMYDWRNLIIQDFKSVDEYNSALFKIVSKLKLCGEDITDKDMLEKTFSTFHTSNVLLQQQYREKGFTTYANLISCLLLAEQNNELLMRNSELRPPGTNPLHEAHATVEAKKESNHVHNSYGRGSYGGRGHGRGRGTSFKPQNSTKSVCHRCGMDNHWAKTCRTPKHLVDLYQESLKGKNPEAHMTYQDGEDDFNHERDDLMDYETSDCLKE